MANPYICDTVRGTTGHIVVVVSPLVNLMKDQATKLANIGIPAVTLSDISEENIKVVERGAFSVVYESPEAWLKIDRWRKWTCTVSMLSVVRNFSELQHD